LPTEVLMVLSDFGILYSKDNLALFQNQGTKVLLPPSHNT
jgi:hypothetical protein